jgi:signal transduction histidine kinase
MNLKRLRIQLAVVYGVLSALAVGSLAFVAIESGKSRILDSAEREADEIALDAKDGEETSNAWYVSIGEDSWEQPLGDVWIEPPLQTMTQDALWDGEPYGRFSEDGPWLSATIRANEDADEAVIAFIELDEFNSDISSLQLRIILAAVAAIATTSAFGWFVAGRSLTPTRQVLAQQRDFIADAAHELRTPLAVIQASATHTLGRDRSEEEYRTSLSEIALAADRASVGVNELLEFARLESGQALPRVAPLRLDLLAEEVAAGIRHESASVRPDVGESVVVDADYNLLRQAVTTVARNAVERASEVVISVDNTARAGRIIVRDNGDGFSDEALPHVFDRFHRGDRRGSTGLGMAIARRIVEVHGGDITAGNHDGGGAEVVISIPRSAAADS